MCSYPDCLAFLICDMQYFCHTGPARRRAEEQADNAFLCQKDDVPSLGPDLFRNKSWERICSPG
jgi:hypothetical protein